MAPKPNEYYRHYKGNYYKVLHIAKHSEDLSPLVIYQAQYGERDVWARPLPMWDEVVEHDGVREPRFRRVNEDEIPEK